MSRERASGSHVWPTCSTNESPKLTTEYPQADGGRSTDESAGTQDTLPPRSWQHGLGRALPGGGAGEQGHEDAGCLRACPGGFYDLARAPAGQQWSVPTRHDDEERGEDLLRRQEG